MTIPSFYKAADSGILINVKVIPGASKNSIDGTIKDADGNDFLKIKVSTQPEKGKANKAVLKLLADELDIPVSALSIISKETLRYKAILISGDKKIIAEKLSSLVK